MITYKGWQIVKNTEGAFVAYRKAKVLRAATLTEIKAQIDFLLKV